jgi:phosphate transport system permease protein
VPPTDLARSSLSLWRRLVDRAANGGMVLAVLVAAIPLGLVIYEVVLRGGGVMSLEFLTSDIPANYRSAGGGMGAAVIGTVIITAGAALIAIPLGLLGAIYLNEYGKQRPLARVIRMMADVMTGVPSIVMGLFIYVAWVLTFQERTGFAGALALACLMLPIVIRSSEEILRLVPDELRQASLALGAARWRTTLTVVLPAASSGITSGSLLAIARAAGETAPIIVTVGLFLRGNWNLFEGENTTLAAQIFRHAQRPFEASQERAWGAALTLIAIVLLFTILARMISSRFAVKGL